MAQYKECKNCQRRLDIAYPMDLCTNCQEDVLFARVRDYIRGQTVNEYMVAEHFDIPLRKVRKWIKEGRIEYVELGTQIVGTTCSRCNKPITFGTLCSDCMRLMNFNQKALLVADLGTDRRKNARMRFLDEMNDNRKKGQNK